MKKSVDTASRPISAGRLPTSSSCMTNHGLSAPPRRQPHPRPWLWARWWGARRVLHDAAVDWSRLTGNIHGTTLATNALIERRGARVATITTERFRDILERLRTAVQPICHQSRKAGPDLAARAHDDHRRKDGCPQTRAGSAGRTSSGGAGGCAPKRQDRGCRSLPSPRLRQSRTNCG